MSTTPFAAATDASYPPLWDRVPGGGYLRALTKPPAGLSGDRFGAADERVELRGFRRVRAGFSLRHSQREHLLRSCRDGDERYDEEKTIEPGQEPVTFEAPCGRVALSICYDMRFPELYRQFTALSLILVPSAFIADEIAFSFLHD